MKKQDVLAVIDAVMNNREIDSIRNAVLAIRDGVLKLDDYDEYLNKCYARLQLRGDNELMVTQPYFPGASYVVIDTVEKIDTGIYGSISYE